MGTVEPRAVDRLRTAAWPSQPRAVWHKHPIEVPERGRKDADAAEQCVLRRRLVYLLVAEAQSRTTPRGVSNQRFIECQPRSCPRHAGNQQEHAFRIAVRSRLLRPTQ